MDVKSRGSSTQTNYTITGKYVSGTARGLEAFCETMRQDHDDREPFSPKETAAGNFAFYAKKLGYSATYNQNETIEVKKNVNN